MTLRIATVLQAALLVLVTALPSQAATVSTRDYLWSQASPDAAATVAAALQREDVRARLEAFGVAPQAALERAAALTPAELAALSARIDELPAGGDILGIIGAVFVVLIILEVVGVTNVFNAL